MISGRKQNNALRKTVLAFYKKHGRAHLSWRKTEDPYRILVSEIMLQQTQVDRVIPKYKSFLKKFPTIRALANASLSAVLKEWQGLGYNRRAKMLHNAAKAIVSEYGGAFPKDREKLMALPGIGPYTASAVRVFAFNEPEVLIETNVRTVYLHHFFPRAKKVSDAQILPLIIPPKGKSREWYSALMDYGSHLKATLPNPSQRSAHHTKQKPFKGSDREIRGAILKLLTQGGVDGKKLFTLPFTKERIQAQSVSLLDEGLISKKGKRFLLGG